MEAGVSARIVSDPGVMLGKPVVEGTRLIAELILEKLAAGESVDNLCASHPRLTEEGVRAALRYARDVLQSDLVLPLASGE